MTLEYIFYIIAVVLKMNITNYGMESIESKHTLIISSGSCFWLTNQFNHQELLNKSKQNLLDQSFVLSCLSLEH